MDSFMAWEYLGMLNAPDDYAGSPYIHGFYNPVYDKMWCFYTHQTHDNFRVGDIVDISGTDIGGEFARRTMKNTIGPFIGANNPFFRDQLEALRLKHKISGYIFKNFDPEKHVEKVWAF